MAVLYATSRKREKLFMKPVMGIGPLELSDMAVSFQWTNIQ